MKERKCAHFGPIYSQIGAQSNGWYHAQDALPEGRTVNTCTEYSSAMCIENTLKENI